MVFSLKDFIEMLYGLMILNDHVMVVRGVYGDKILLLEFYNLHFKLGKKRTMRKGFSMKELFLSTCLLTGGLFSGSFLSTGFGSCFG